MHGKLVKPKFGRKARRRLVPKEPNSKCATTPHNYRKERDVDMVRIKFLEG